ncbi:MAG: hypothetical protein CMA86_04580, partial [Euryarchaeota archaeon]|nr:hypothetical protein [Euryarchaeota archaeon]
AHALPGDEAFGPEEDAAGKPYVHNQELRRVLDIDGVGEIVALQFRDGLAQRRELVDDLVEQLTIEAEPVQQAGGVFEGMTFCVTGTLSVARKEVQQRIIDAGGKIVGSVSSKLDVLVAGEKAGSKLAKATALEVTVWSENDLSERLRGTPHEESTDDSPEDAPKGNTSSPQASLRDFLS